MKTIHLGLTDSPENPLETDCWKLYSFNRNHRSFKDPDYFFPNGRPDENPVPIGLRRKLAVGTAFILSYTEHGQCEWGVEGTIGMPVFDSCSIAGLLIWEDSVKNLGPKTYADRQKDAEGVCAVYSEWCNGNVYGYSVEEKGEVIDSCWGFYDVGEKGKDLHLSGQGCVYKRYEREEMVDRARRLQ